jgi:hypothetical protein
MRFGDAAGTPSTVSDIERKGQSDVEPGAINSREKGTGEVAGELKSALDGVHNGEKEGADLMTETLKQFGPG